MRLSILSGFSSFISFDMDIDGNARYLGEYFFDETSTYLKKNYNFDMNRILVEKNQLVSEFEETLKRIKRFQLYERGL